jgi:MFS family permease
MSQQTSTLDRSAWHVLLATWFGMLFDGMDASIYVLTLYPSLSELLNTTSHATVGSIGAIVIAVFMFGWTLGAVCFGLLADYIGRVKTLIITVLLYTICTGLCATSHSWEQLALYRFLVGMGIGGEISIGGVMVAECWFGKSRLHATGGLQTAYGCGCLLLAAINMAIGHLGWRYLYVVGMVPALLAIYVRLKLKELPDAEAVRRYRAHLMKQPGEMLSDAQSKFLRFPFFELFTHSYLTKTVAIVAMSSTTCMGYWAVVAWIPAWINQLTGTAAVQERSLAMLIQNLAAILAAASGGWIVLRLGRAWSFRMAFIGSLISCIAMFLGTKVFGPALLTWISLAGFFTVAPFTYLFIYIPELFETRLRATAFGFSMQFGRIFAGLAAIMGGQLISLFGGSYATAGACVSLLFLLGIIASFFLPYSDGCVSTEMASETLEKPFSVPELIKSK